MRSSSIECVVFKPTIHSFFLYAISRLEEGIWHSRATYVYRVGANMYFSIFRGQLSYRT